MFENISLRMYPSKIFQNLNFLQMCASVSGSPDDLGELLLLLLLLLPQCNVCFLFISGLQLACTQLLAPFSISQIFLKCFSQATESSSNVCFVSKWFGAGLGLYPFIFTICFYFNPMYWWLCIRCASQKYVSTFIRPNI